MLDQQDLNAGGILATTASDQRQSTANGAIIAIAFALPIFAGAFLLFLLQPLIGKYILPWFGGSAAVWTTCMLFFQVLLLGGYAYAHASIKLLRPRMQVIVHTVLLLAALAMLPITPAARWKPAGGENPTLQILILLTVSVGLPYFVLSATAPLLQAWFSRLSNGRSPYRLYALSNAASLLALLGYPFVFEPLLSRSAQTRFWSWGLGAFALTYVLGAVMLARGDRSDEAPKRRSDEGEESQGDSALSVAPRLIDRFFWVALPACACAMLLAATNKICQDIAVIPFLWVAPLSLYLLTFIIAFDSPRWYYRPVWIPLLVISLVGLVVVLFNDEMDIRYQIGLYCAAMFMACMICHGEMARLRPHPSRLTSFYLCISAGGAIGGLAVGLLAPLLLQGYYELHIAIFACGLLLLAVLFFDPSSPLYRARNSLVWLGAMVMLVALGGVLYTNAARPAKGETKITQQRNFYGTLSVSEENVDNPEEHLRLLSHGAITHGIQYLSPDKRRQPTAYYIGEHGVESLFNSLRPDQPRTVGVIGLGTGTLAAYGRQGDTYHFYELNAAVERFARTYFTYLGDSPAKVDVVLGDARLSMERQPSQGFDILVIDAFSGDAIPVHLLTREAIQLYLKHMKSDGVIAVHITNRHLELEPVVSAIADDLQLHAAALHCPEDEAEGYASDWVLLARDATVLATGNLAGVTERPVRSAKVKLWTDDHTSLYSILK